MCLPTLHYVPLDYYLCSCFGDVPAVADAAAAVVAVLVENDDDDVVAVVFVVIETRHCSALHIGQIITHTHTHTDLQKALCD